MSRLKFIISFALFIFFTLTLYDITERLDRIEKKQTPPVLECPAADLDRACPGWWFHSDLIEARKRLCGRK